MKQGDKVIYKGPKHSILEYGEVYEVFREVTETGVQLVIPTGFAGVSKDDVVLLKD